MSPPPDAVAPAVPEAASFPAVLEVQERVPRASALPRRPGWGIEQPEAVRGLRRGRQQRSPPGRSACGRTDSQHDGQKHRPGEVPGRD